MPDTPTPEVDEEVTLTMIFDEADSDACGLMADDLYVAACVTLTADRDRLRGEVERLTETLEEIAHRPSYSIDHRIAFEDAISRATAALTAKEEK